MEGPLAEQPKRPAETASERREKLVATCFALIARGKVAAMSDLYDLTAADLFGYIRSIVGSAADAEDVFQEVFARIAARGAKLVQVEKPLAYMFTIARNEAFSLLNDRSMKRRMGEETALFEEPMAPTGEQALTAREASDALAQIPTDQREAVVLKIYEGFTFAEIAGITEVSANTAASRYRYGIEKLAKLLGRSFKEDSR